MAATINKRKNIFILLLAVSLLILLAVGLDLINPKNRNEVELNNENNQKTQPIDSVSIFKKVIDWESYCGGVHRVVIRNFSVDTQGNIYIIEASNNGIIKLSPEGKILNNFYHDDLRCEKEYTSSGEYDVYITTAITGSKNYLYLYLQRMHGSYQEKIYKIDINTGSFEEIWNGKMKGFEGSFAASWDVDDNDNLYFVLNALPATEVAYNNQKRSLTKNRLDNSLSFWQITKNNLFRHYLFPYIEGDNSLSIYDLENNFIRKFEPEHLKRKDDVFSWFGYDGNFYVITKQPDNTFILERIDTDNNVLARTQAKDYTSFNRNDVRIEIGFDGKVYISYVDREQGLYGVDRYEF